MADSARQCYPRKRFKTEESASAAAHRIGIDKDIDRWPEYCRLCKGYHLSKPAPQRPRNYL